jgi:hypothetical protein
MCPSDQTQPVVVVELVHDLGAEEPAHSTMVLRPSFDFLGVRPHEIAEGSLGGYFLEPIDFSDLIEGVDIGGESSMNAEDVILVTTMVLSTSAANGR